MSRFNGLGWPMDEDEDDPHYSPPVPTKLQKAGYQQEPCSPSSDTPETDAALVKYLNKIRKVHGGEMNIYNTEKGKQEMGFPKDGQKITFKKPTEMCWFKNVVDDQRYLAVGQEYTVRKTQLNSSSSYVWLEELEPYDTERDMPFFNLWSFDWEGKLPSWIDKL